jgi:nucleoside-diphosphate-sugar epimerase
MEKQGRVVVTGAAGFIGSHTCAKLLGLGYPVIGIDNLSNGFMANLNPVFSHPQFEFRQSDMESIDPASLGPVSGIFHLASEKIPRDPSDEGFHTIHQSMKSLDWVGQLWKFSRAKLVFSSTSEVYGPFSSLPFREDQPVSIGTPNDKRWVYAASKIQSEHYLMALARHSGLKLSIARLFSVYGPQQHPSWKGGVQSDFIEKVRKGLPIEIHGDGEQKRIFTFIEDAIKALMVMFEKEEANGQIFNVQGPESDEVSVKELAQLILELFGNDPENYPITKRTNYYYQGKDAMQSKVADLTKIKAILNWKAQIGLREGLLKTVQG